MCFKNKNALTFVIHTPLADVRIFVKIKCFLYLSNRWILNKMYLVTRVNRKHNHMIHMVGRLIIFLLFIYI